MFRFPSTNVCDVRIPVGCFLNDRAFFRVPFKRAVHVYLDFTQLWHFQAVVPKAETPLFSVLEFRDLRMIRITTFRCLLLKKKRDNSVRTGKGWKSRSRASDESTLM